MVLEMPVDFLLNINRIVENMKTLNGKDLLAYLRRDLRMNDPFKAINHKVRIKQLQQQGDEKMARCFQRKCAEEMKINLKLYNLLKDNNIDLL